MHKWRRSQFFFQLLVWWYWQRSFDYLSVHEYFFFKSFPIILMLMFSLRSSKNIGCSYFFNMFEIWERWLSKEYSLIVIFNEFVRGARKLFITFFHNALKLICFEIWLFLLSLAQLSKNAAHHSHFSKSVKTFSKKNKIN